MYRRLIAFGKWQLLIVMLCAIALAGCSGKTQAEVIVDSDFADAGLMQALAEIYTEETGTEIIITATPAEEIDKLLDAGQFDKCIITNGDNMPAFIEENGLQGGEFCFDSLMLIAPLDDRAGIAQLKDVSGADVLKHIALTQSNFVHAPADSPLGKIEQKLWQEAGHTPEGDWYISAGSDGLGILDEAQARNAYALVDRRSVALVSAEYVSLKVVYANLKGMSSSYYVLTEAPAEGDDDNAAQAFARWLLSDGAQAAIAGYDVMGDEPAFLPGQAADYNPILPTPAPEPTIEQTPVDTGQVETPSAEQPSSEPDSETTPPSQQPEESPSASPGEEEPED